MGSFIGIDEDYEQQRKLLRLCTLKTSQTNNERKPSNISDLFLIVKKHFKPTLKLPPKNEKPMRATHTQKLQQLV